LIGEALAAVCGTSRPFGTDMIRNGLYALHVEMQDGIEGGDNGVVVWRDGTIRGGDSHFYFIGSCTCSGGKWKGEVTSQEQPIRPLAATSCYLSRGGYSHRLRH
jgi:hypothetical protein